MIGPAAVLGSETSVSNRATIRNSSVGKNCTIGKGSVINNSQISDRVTILVILNTNTVNGWQIFMIV